MIVDKEIKQIIKMYFLVLLFATIPLLILLYFFGNTKITVNIYISFVLITFPFFVIYCLKKLKMI
jgi:hypothetical protein